MKVYCINLDRRPDRLAYMSELFGQLGVPFERIVAVDAQSPEVAAKAASCAPGMTGRRMSAGAYGCFQSHRNVWQRLVASSDSHAMIFEDDLLLAPGVADLLSPGWIPADADLVKLETLRTRLHLSPAVGSAVQGRALHRMHSRHAGTGAYVISATAAARLLRQTETFADPIDEVLFNEASPLFPGLVVYQMSPAPVIQGEFSGQVKAGWSATSITQRFASGDEPAPARAEGRIARLVRRGTQEVIARAKGTRYVVVPFG